MAAVTISNVDKKSVEGEWLVQVCNYTDVYYNERITTDLTFMEATATEDQLARFALRAGDVLITKDSETAEDIAVPAYVTTNMPAVVCGYHLAIARPSPLVDGRFLFWALASQSTREQFSASATGVTRFGLRYVAYGEVRIPLPSLRDQHAIAEYLDTETARIDALIEKKGRIVELLQERQQARSVDLLELAGKESRWIRLGQVLDRIIDYRGATPEKSDDGIPLLTASNVVDGHVDMTSRQFIPASLYRAWMRRGLPRADDILLTTEAPLGQVALVGDPHVALAQRLMLLRCRKDIVIPEYLLAYLRSNIGQAQLLSRASGSTVMGVRTDRLRELVVQVPPLSAQVSIAKAVGHMDGLARRGAMQLSAQIDLLSERRNGLITAAVTGELDVPGVAA